MVSGRLRRESREVRLNIGHAHRIVRTATEDPLNPCELKETAILPVELVDNSDFTIVEKDSGAVETGAEDLGLKEYNSPNIKVAVTS